MTSLTTERTRGSDGARSPEINPFRGVPPMTTAGPFSSPACPRSSDSPRHTSATSTRTPGRRRSRMPWSWRTVTGSVSPRWADRRELLQVGSMVGGKACEAGSQWRRLRQGQVAAGVSRSASWTTPAAAKGGRGDPGRDRPESLHRTDRDHPGRRRVPRGRAHIPGDGPFATGGPPASLRRGWAPRTSRASDE